jgi:2-oxoglutarate ferredoxin oxidoreductase subunit beta
VLLRKVAKNYDPASRGAALEYIRARHRNGEIVTGLLYIDEGDPDMHGVNGTVAEPLTRLPYEQLCPGQDALRKLQQRFR